MIVKICGIKRKDTLLCCEKNNVNFFGMIFYKKSPRNISMNEASKLQKIAKNLRINGVGVFVNEQISDLKSCIKNLNLNYVQLHGSENNDYIKELKNSKVSVIKKISIKEKKDLININKYQDADFFLFDYKPIFGELPGGNAKSFDWNILKDVKINKSWFISGGIHIENIHIIAKNIKPFGVDLSSGVEKELGIKDNGIINNFMDKINYA